MEEVETVAYEYETLPKSVIFNSATVTSTNRTNIFISLSGSITTRTGGTKSIKYRIIYDREELFAELE